MICKPFQIVDVPFPFSDIPRAKRRKALVLSNEDFNRHNGATILMMITSATRSAWKLDVPISEWDKAGLNKPCVARAKIFTLDNRLIVEQIGKLLAKDVAAVRGVLKKALPIK
jgi:mRNA interferase MazF